jgi:hypothetical protein
MQKTNSPKVRRGKKSSPAIKQNNDEKLASVTRKCSSISLGLTALAIVLDPDGKHGDI